LGGFRLQQGVQQRLVALEAGTGVGGGVDLGRRENIAATTSGTASAAPLAELFQQLNTPSDHTRNLPDRGSAERPNRR